MHLRTFSLIASATALSAGTALAAPGDIYFEDFDDSNAATRWTEISTGSGGASNLAFDYSTVGLANPTGGTSTIGAAFNPNTAGSPGSIGASANGLNATGDFTARFYFAYTLNPQDSSGSTEAAIFGMNGDTAGVTMPIWDSASDGVGYGFTVDGFGGGGIPDVTRWDADNATRYYDNYDVDADADPDLPPSRVPPTWDSFGPPEGEWQLIEMYQVANEVSVFINGNLFDTFDNSAGNTAGTVFIGAMDTFGGSVGDHFHIFDNVEVTTDIVPEPATAALLGLGGLAMLRRRSA